jgi:predicted exporter
VGTAVLTVAGILPLLGMPLTAASIVAAMVVVGLCIDYGIFMVHAGLQRLQCGTSLSVTLSALTTLVGAGSLLLARHPVMYAIGITLVFGVASGYVCAVCVVPALHAATGSEARAR